MVGLHSHCGGEYSSKVNVACDGKAQSSARDMSLVDMMDCTGSVVLWDWLCGVCEIACGGVAVRKKYCSVIFTET